MSQATIIRCCIYSIITHTLFSPEKRPESVWALELNINRDRSSECLPLPTLPGNQPQFQSKTENEILNSAQHRHQHKGARIILCRTTIATAHYCLGHSLNVYKQRVKVLVSFVILECSELLQSSSIFYLPIKFRWQEQFSSA